MAKVSTTVIGSFQKPDYLQAQIPGWIKADGKINDDFVESYEGAIKGCSRKKLEEQILRATKETITLQEDLGIDVICDGEMRRDNYINGYLRTLHGIDFFNLEEKLCRNGACVLKLPTVVSEVYCKESVPGLLSPEAEWRIAQDMSSKPVKFTLPGPMTIADTIVNKFYKNDRELQEKLVTCVQSTVQALAKSGCKNIQIDECVLVRYPEQAVEYAIDNLAKCFEGVPEDVARIVHICCGYPNYLDQEDYQKAELDAYGKLADKLDEVGIDYVSLEDAHRRNDLNVFSKFKKTKVILGVVDVVRSRVETVEEIKQHANEVMSVLPKERLVLAPDCGLVYLPHKIMMEKLQNMVTAASQL